MLDDTTSPPEVKDESKPPASDVDEPVAGPSRERIPSPNPIRYSRSRTPSGCTSSTFIHGQYPIRAPRVLVLCLLYTLCSPLRPSPPVPQSNVAELNPAILLPSTCPQGVVYLHPHHQPFNMSPPTPVRYPPLPFTPHPLSPPPCSILLQDLSCVNLLWDL